jgi:hypothetical protein
MRIRNRLLGVTIALLLLLMVGLTVIAAPTPQASSEDVEQAIDQALSYLRIQQLPSGGIDSFEMGSGDPAGTAKAVIAIAATGRSAQWTVHLTSGLSLIDFLTAEAITYTHEAPHADSAHLFPMQAGTLLAAVAAADADPTDFGGMNLLGQINETYIAETGAYSTTAAGGWFTGEATPLSQAWVILGLSAAGQPVPVPATDWLIDHQDEAGSWASDPDTTGLAVTALIGSGNVPSSHVAIQNALAWLKAEQLPNGGWRPTWDSDPANANSTGMILQALTATGYTPPDTSWATADGDPVQALLALQKEDGRIGGTYANAFSTVDAILGLSDQPAYLLGRWARAQRGLGWVSAQQNEDGSWSGFSGPDVGATSDAALAFVAAGYDPDTVRLPGGASALEYLIHNAASYAAQSSDRTGKVALALAASGVDPRDVGGTDLIDLLLNTWYDVEIGAFGVPTNTYHQSFAILALVAAEEQVPMSATLALADLQQADGGWKYDLGTSAWNVTDAAHTGLALQALIAARTASGDHSLVPDAVIEDAIDYMRDTQGADGGWEGANATAYAVQGLLAAGEDLDSNDWMIDERTPFSALAAYQKTDGPMVWQWSWPADNGLATWQGLQALLGLYFPYVPAEPLQPFDALDALPDPDRLVAATPIIEQNSVLTLTVPFGSDLNADSSLAVSYRPAEDGEWLTAEDISRKAGQFTVVVPLTADEGYWLRLTLTDPDGVQVGSALRETVQMDLVSTMHLYFPLVFNP